MAAEIIKWEDDFNTGDAQIDEQHKQVFDYITQLQKALKLKKDEEEILLILKGLSDYSVFHFQLEEEMMLKSNFPQYKSHKHEHQVFIDRLSKLSMDMETTKKSINLRLLKFLKVWFSGHILNTDKKFVDYLKSPDGK